MVVSVDVIHTFKYPLDFVVNTHFTKYPNAKEKYVQKIETIEQQIDKNSGVNYIRRIATCHNVIPAVLRLISALNVKEFLLEEKSWLDAKKQSLHLKSRNLTWCNYANMWEESVFKPCPENPKWTQLKQHGVIDIQGIGPFGRVIEMFAEKFLHAGVKRGLSIMEDLLLERHQEKVTDLDGDA
ncbi:PRELI domain-containing protein 2-like [Mizuhopecten yessoensis]|uniref:PRELI domain-containing protein 2 n=1 Tax=Mizuhopecten yessoensis TaxID=6573 RepID=A0A210Q1A0_MIZYE|nr:PRELI domain-containing protein 2-like [Mizuhopecten yessoensis]OWF42530.1 PRELI domain-containing protein 2 [Mizuhopecten yessoensis]